MKNRIFNIGVVFTVISIFAIVFSSCSKDELDTNPLANKETTVVAYGPNPALRGQKMSFVGTQLDKITKVILPNGIEITDIEFVNDKLIKVIVPENTIPGAVKLIGANGKEYTFKKLLEISEPIEITSMKPQPVKAGQKLTIEGNYFDLITKVILNDKVEILSKDFETYERTKIVLTVPVEAQSGVVILADDAEIPLEYQSPEPLQVVLPSVTAVLDLTNKKPGDVISSPGKDLDLIVKLQMPNGKEVPFTITDNVLKFTLPADISDGAIVMIPTSGVNVVVGNIGVAMPDKIVAAPIENLRAGTEITLTGINMELITNISFPGAGDAVEPVSKTATEVKVLFPEKAISGDMILHTASGKTVPIEISTQKPDVMAFTPAPASAGSNVVLKGHNLDLVVSVTFESKLVVEVTSTKADELTVGIPLNAHSGSLILTMANGETVKTSELEITAPVFAFLPNPPGPKAEIHAGGVLSSIVENGDKLTDVQVNGASVKYILDKPNLYIVIPNDAKGVTELKLISSNGTAVYTIPVIGAGVVETVVFEGLHAISWGEPLRVNKDAFESVPAGSKFRIYVAPATAGNSIAYNDANWNKFTIANDPNFDPQWGTVKLPEGSTNYDIELTADILNGIRTISDGWSQTGIMLTGDGLVISKISLIVGTAPEEIEVFKGPHALDWGNTIRIYKEGLDGARNGSILKLYFTPGAAPSFAIQDANWGKIAFPSDPNFDTQWESITVPEGVDNYEVKLTTGIINRLMTTDDGWSTTAIILGGADMNVSKITLIK